MTNKICNKTPMLIDQAHFREPLSEMQKINIFDSTFNGENVIDSCLGKWIPF